MSVRYLQNLFEEMGTTPSRWLREARLERARGLLVTTPETVAAISTIIGFKDCAHFSRSFAALHGQSPSSYRRDRRAS